MKKVLNCMALLGVLAVVAGCTTPSNPTTTSSAAPSTSASTTSAPTTSSPTTSEVTSSVQELKETKIYVVGDSTLSSFNDSTYYYPRYGYATQLSNYLDDKATVVNLALSGRSSKSFLSESNYQTLKDSIKEGDYLVIGFGHNDEKSDDASRFTDASKSTDDPTSFKYSLYENYVKLATEKGATPILCSPIVRASNKDDYSGNNGHVTSTGNYAQAVLDLASEKEVNVVDMTKLTKDLYTTLGYNEAVYLHAMTAGKKDGDNIVANVASVDTTHLNIYGAKMVAYLFANEVLESDSSLAAYVDEDKLIEPTKEKDLVSNPSYVYSDYEAPDLASYSPVEHFQTLSEGWYGTAFGDVGGTPTSASNGYIAKEIETGVFHVGQYLEGKNKGKFSTSSEGFAYLFRQVDASKNFTLTAKAKVLTSAETNQAGFGLMLRDDAYLPQNEKSIIGNYIASGFLTQKNNVTKIIFDRTSMNEINDSGNNINNWYAVDDEATFTITRLGQKVTVTVEYKGKTYTEEYLDFPLTTKDKDHMYIGMFANRGTTVEFTNVVFEITGDAIEA